MLALEIVLPTAAFLAGLTGAWSPCGFSSVETIGTMARRARTKLAACTSFAAGALLGGAAMFAALAWLGALVPGAGGRAAVAVAAIVALAAAAGELRGVPIAPQIRRQVPEPWRRAMPLPVAAGLYGVLLGVGFATFVLTFAVWGLAAVTFALADPSLGVLVGLAFGAGRALPVAVMAPLLSRPLGARLAESMAERPLLLRRLRFADGVALSCCALALAAGEASAAPPVAQSGTDPTVAGDLLAWDGPKGGMVTDLAQRPGGGAHHLTGLARALPGTDPALGGSLLAWREGREIRVVRRDDFAPVASFAVPDANALAVSDRWLVYRGRGFHGGDRLAARPLTRPHVERTVASIGRPGQLGRPALEGDTLVFHVARLRSSEIVEVKLPTRARRILRSSRLEQLTNPAVRRGRLLYVRQSSMRQLLQLGPLAPRGRDRILYAVTSASRRDAGYQIGYSPITQTPRPGVPARDLFWTTALSPRYAYLTLLRARAPRERPTIVRVRR